MIYIFCVAAFLQMLLGTFSVGNVAVGGIPKTMNCIAHEYGHGWVRYMLLYMS